MNKGTRSNDTETISSKKEQRGINDTLTKSSLYFAWHRIIQCMLFNMRGRHKDTRMQAVHGNNRFM